MRNPMRRPRQRRLEAATHLVLSLCSGLEACKALTDAILDALVIAGLEMQTVEFAVPHPSSVHKVRSRCENRWPLPRESAVQSKLHHEVVREARGEFGEESQAQVGVWPWRRNVAA